jgi:hypothetical protein
MDIDPEKYSVIFNTTASFNLDYANETKGHTFASINITIPVGKWDGSFSFPLSLYTSDNNYYFIYISNLPNYFNNTDLGLLLCGGATVDSFYGTYQNQILHSFNLTSSSASTYYLGFIYIYNPSVPPVYPMSFFGVNYQMWGNARGTTSIKVRCAYL